MATRDSGSYTDNFVTYLVSLAERNTRYNRQKLATLRHRVAQPTHPEVSAVLARWMLRNGNPWFQDCLCMTAVLFAQYPRHTPEADNLGASLAALGEAERSFELLLKSNSTNLYTQLHPLILRLRAGEIPINWGTLLRDLSGWTHPAGYVQKNWHRHYYLPMEVNNS